MTRFVPNPRFEEDMADDPEIQQVLEAAAAEAATAAKQVAGSFAVTGAYQESIHSEGTALVSDDPAAMFIEFGSVHNKPYGALRRGVEQTGARYVDDA